MSAVHKRLHYAQKKEFRILARIFRDNLPQEYPYDVAGGDRKIMASDFDGRVTNGNTTARKRSHAMATNVFVVTKLNTTTLGLSSLHIASPISQFPIKSSGNKNGRQSTDPMSEMAKFITKQYVLV